MNSVENNVASCMLQYSCSKSDDVQSGWVCIGAVVGRLPDSAIAPYLGEMS